MKYITCVDVNSHGGYEIYGSIGFRQYYGYCKRDAIRRYNAECREKEERNKISQKSLLYV